MPASQGVVNVDSMNKTQGKHNHSRSTFADSLSYRNHFTARFGEYTPSFVMEGEPTDRVSVNTLDLIDSMSLKAPFKGSIRKIKESFKVPLMAILPKNWDRIYTQPSNGDDVPHDAYCTLQNFPDNFSAWWKSFYDLVGTSCAALTSSSTLGDCEAVLNAIWKTLILGEYVYSNGSLLSVCGYHAGSQFIYTKPLNNTGNIEDSYNPCSYDQWFDAAITLVFGRIKQFNFTYRVGSGSETFIVRGPSSSGEAGTLGTFYNTFRFFLEKARENPHGLISDVVFRNDTTLGDYIQLLQTLAGNTTNGLFEADKVFFFLPSDTGISTEDFTERSTKRLDLSRLLSYQLVCAHYYSNSSIDFIYSAELYRSYIYSLYCENTSTPSSTVHRTFQWNGMLCEYDALSENILARTLYLKRSATSYFDPANNLEFFDLGDLTDPTDSRFPFISARLACFAAIFGFRKSLRFGDYFVGARPRPLAPINTDVSVNNNAVSVIDVTRNIQAQRFGNAVMRSRQKIEEYVASLFGGGQPAPDFHNPFFLSRETETIFGEEVQNTGVAQQNNPNSRTSNFASRAGRFTFTFDNSDKHKCIYIQIISFDIKRAYTRSVDRQFLVLDRYDMFNPDFQYIGDQPIYGIELGYNYGSFIPRVFGYTSRDMEYKQRFDVASGGFVEELPGWILTDRNREHYQPAKLSPDFIRSFSCELDQFYISLTGYSLSSYFHFAIITNNNVSATRPMAVDPQILE